MPAGTNNVTLRNFEENLDIPRNCAQVVSPSPKQIKQQIKTNVAGGVNSVMYRLVLRLLRGHEFFKPNCRRLNIQGIHKKLVRFQK
jgi:hypothetical protein